MHNARRSSQAVWPEAVESKPARLMQYLLRPNALERCRNVSIPLGMPVQGEMFTAAIQSSPSEAIMRSYFPPEDVFYHLTFWMLKIQPLPHFVAYNFVRCCHVSHFLFHCCKMGIAWKRFLSFSLG